MTDYDIDFMLEEILDAIEEDLAGAPYHISRRRGAEDYVLLPSSTYAALQQRIYELEDMLKDQTDKEVEAAVFEFLSTNVTIH